MAEIENMRFGQVCATIVNVRRKRGGKKYKASDFFKSIKERKQQSIDDMDKILRAWTQSMGGEVIE